MFLSPLGDLSKTTQQELERYFNEGDEYFLIQPYLEGDWKGLHYYSVRPRAEPNFHKSWRDVLKNEHRLIRGDKVALEHVDAKDDYFEIRIKLVERRAAEMSAGQRFWGTALFGLAGLAAGQGKYEIQPQSKLRFHGTSTEEIINLASHFLSKDPPKIELEPGMSPDEVQEILGEPEEVFVFGEKKTYKYPNLKAIFVDDKLTDIEFEQEK